MDAVKEVLLSVLLGALACRHATVMKVALQKMIAALTFML